MVFSMFVDFFQNVDGVLQLVFMQVVNGMLGYVLFIGWVMFGVLVLVWLFFVMQGKIDLLMNDWVMKGIIICLIFYVVGNYYLSWIFVLLFKLFSEFFNVIGISGSFSQIFDLLSDKMQGFCMGIGLVMVDFFQNLNVGGGVIFLVVLLFVFVVCILFFVVVVYNILYVKFGFVFVFVVGLFFVIWLIWK